MATGFPYATVPLNASAQEIRVIELESVRQSLSGDVLHFKVKRIPLKAPFVSCYCAISYTWGDSSDRRVIYIDGHESSVPRNTFEALKRLCYHNPRYSMKRHFRRRRYKVPLWIDAVCINQSDVVERSQQVAMMAKIYASAHEVLVWLGHGNGREAETFFLIDTILWFYSSQIKPLNGGKESFVKSSTHRRAQPTRQNAVFRPSDKAAPIPKTVAIRTRDWDTESLDLTDLQWHLLEDLFSDRWFTRLWVLQEIALAVPSRRMFYRGSACIDGNKIIQVARFMIHVDYTKHSVFRSRGIWCARVLHELCHTAGHNRLFLTHLLLSGVFDCRDPRDKVFALLGLLSPQERHRLEMHAPINPDYSKSVSAIYRDATRAVILEYEDLSLLQLAGHRIARMNLLSAADQETSLRASSGGLPSWVPNYEASSSSYGTPLILAEHGPKPGKLEACTSCSEYADPDILGIRGVLIDEISHKWSEFHNTTSEGLEALATELRRVLKVIRKFLGVEPTEERDKSLLEGLCITLACGRTADNTNAYKDDTFMKQMSLFLHHFVRHEWAKSLDAQGQLQSQYRSLLEETYLTSARVLLEAVSNTHGRSFYITSRGLMGMGLSGIKPGDAICHLFGGEMCVVLRKQGEVWKLMGDTYVHELAQRREPIFEQRRCFHII